MKSWNSWCTKYFREIFVYLGSISSHQNICLHHLFRQIGAIAQFDQDIDHLTKSGQDFSAKVQMIHGSALPKVWLKVLLKALVKVLVKVLVKALVKQMWIPAGKRLV